MCTPAGKKSSSKGDIYGGRWSTFGFLGKSVIESVFHR